MKLFGQFVRTAINTALLPVAVAKDVVTLGGSLNNRGETYTEEQLRILKDEADEVEDE